MAIEHTLWDLLPGVRDRASIGWVAKDRCFRGTAGHLMRAIRVAKGPFKDVFSTAYTKRAYWEDGLSIHFGRPKWALHPRSRGHVLFRERGRTKDGYTLLLGAPFVQSECYKACLRAIFPEGGGTAAWESVLLHTITDGLREKDPQKNTLFLPWENDNDWPEYTTVLRELAKLDLPAMKAAYALGGGSAIEALVEAHREP